jgi:DNA-binding transcriptional LysR family regulator
MELRQLRHFLAVAETLHFGRAAEQLGMTQPPLSQSIMALERALGTALFVRSKRSVALTDFGAAWRDHVRRAIDGIAELPDIAQRLRLGMTGRLSLAFVSVADYSLLPPLVRGYTAAFPDVELALIEATGDVQIEALLAGRIDAGLLFPSRSGFPPALDYRSLLRETLVAAIPEAWIENGRFALIDGEVAGLDWLDLPLILFPARVAPGLHDLVLSLYRKHGRDPAIRQEAIQMQTIVSLVSAGMGIAFVPASMQHLARTGVRYAALADPSPLLETGLAWRRDDGKPTLAALIEIADRLAAPFPIDRPTGASQDTP